MKLPIRFAAIGLIALTSTLYTPLSAQDGGPGLGEVVVTAHRSSQPYYRQDRPVVGLRRQADSAAWTIRISSDSRDEAERKRDIQAVLAAAMDRAAAEQVELVTGDFELVPLTREYAANLPYSGAGRPDTSQVTVRAKVRLTGSVTDAQRRIDAFVSKIPRKGRALLEADRGFSLTIIDPDQYRGAIVKAVADHATKQAAAFGLDYRVTVTGLDEQVAWSQVSGTEVFLFLPYDFTIVAK